MILLLKMNDTSNQNQRDLTKDEALKKDFKIGQYVYIAIYVSLVIALILIYS